LQQSSNIRSRGGASRATLLVGAPESGRQLATAFLFRGSLLGAAVGFFLSSTLLYVRVNTTAFFYAAKPQISAPAGTKGHLG
jgi:hypothetical protein